MRHIARALLLASLALANLLVIWSPDVIPASLFSWTILREGDVDYDEFTFIDREAYFFRACGESTAVAAPQARRSPGGPPAPGPRDRVCSIFPPGAALFAVPFFAPFVLAGEPPDQLPLLLTVGKFVAALEEAAAAVLLIAAMWRVATPGWALSLGLLYLLGTGVRTITSQALWQHGAVHLLLAVGLLILVRYWTFAGVTRMGLFVAGAAFGFAIVARQTSVVFAVAGLALLLFSRRPFIEYVMGVVVGVSPLLAYNLAAFGHPLEQGYGLKLFATPILEGLQGLLVSPSRGLFVYSPFLIFALPPLVLSWLSRDPLAPIWRWFGLAVAGLVVGYAMYAEWWGGRVYGARFLTDALPVLFLVLAASPPRRLLRPFFALAALWAVAIHTVGALVYDQSWDTVPVNVNDDPSKIFSWTDPQWLAAARELIAPAPDEVMRLVVAGGLTVLILVVLYVTERRSLRAADGVPSAG